MIVMAKYSFKSQALKWHYFSYHSSSIAFVEYFNLFMKQLGFNSAQIGLTTLFGLPHLLIPLCLLFGEKFRVRKAVAVFGCLAAFVCCTLPLSALVIPALQPKCDTTSHSISNDSNHNKRLADSINYGSVHSKYVSYTNMVFGFTIRKTQPSSVTPTSALATAPTSNTRSAHPIHVKATVQPCRTKIHRTMPSSAFTNSLPFEERNVPTNKNGQLYFTYSKRTTQANGLKFRSFTKRRLNNSVALQQALSGYGSIQPRHLGSSKSNIVYLRSNLTTNVSSLLANYSKTSIKSSHDKTYITQQILGALFLILVVSRTLTTVCIHANEVLMVLATVTYLKSETSNLGRYYMFSHLGGAFSVACVAVLAWTITINICGIESHGYFIAFIWGGVMFVLSMLSIPSFKFEYNEKKRFSWSSVKSGVLNVHYMLMFLLVFFSGLCLAFQLYWEFWYLDSLSASPLLIAGAALVRRPLLAISMYTSSHLIRKFGDLNTVCVALFFYSLSYLALSFIRTAWLVVVIDTFQATAYGFGYCAFCVVFYKASSKENSSMILGNY